MPQTTLFKNASDLISALSDRFAADEVLKDDVLVICQSRPFIDLITYKLAQARGVFIKPRMELAETLFRQILEAIRLDGEPLEGVDKIVFPDSLSLWIWDFLLKPEQEEVLRGLGLYGSNPLRVYEYAGAMAKAYHQFTLNQDEPNNWDSDEADKKVIYERLLSVTENKYVTLGAMLSRTAKKLKTASQIHLPFKKILVLGSAFLPIKGIEFLQVLRDIDIEFMIVNPLELDPSHPYDLDSWTSFGRTNFASITGTDLVGNALCLEGKQELSIVACPGMQHEVRFVKEKILEILAREPETPLNKIGIIAPNPGDYEPYLKSIFADSNPAFDLSLHIVDEEIKPLSSLASLLSLLSSHSSNLKRSEVLELLSQEPIQKTFGLNQDFYDSLKKWIIDSGIFEHLDSELRENEGILSGERGTWASLLRKIGSLLLRGPQDDIAISSLGSSHFEAIEGFMKFLALMEAFQKQVKIPRLIKDWATFTRELFDPENRNCFVTWADDEDEERQKTTLSNVIGNTVNLTHDMRGFEKKIDFEFYLCLLREQLEGQYVQKGQALLHGVTVGRFSPARLIPFKHLFVIGLNDKAFPAPAAKKRLESINGKPIKESREQDLYCLVEVFASVTHSLHFSYQARDQRSRDWTPPSSVLWSLKDWLGDRVKSVELTLTELDPAGHSSKTLPQTVFVNPQRLSLVKTNITSSKSESNRKLKDYLDLDKLKTFFTTPFSAFYEQAEDYHSYYDSENSVDDDPNFDLTNSNRKKLRGQSIEGALSGDFDEREPKIKAVFEEGYATFAKTKDLLDDVGREALQSQDGIDLEAFLDAVTKEFGSGQNLVQTDFFRIPSHEAIDLAPDLPKIVANLSAWRSGDRVAVIDSSGSEIKDRHAGYFVFLSALASLRVNQSEKFSGVKELWYFCLKDVNKYLTATLSPTDETYQTMAKFYRGLFESPKPLFPSLLLELFKTDENLNAIDIRGLIDDIEPNDRDYKDPHKDPFFRIFLNYQLVGPNWEQGAYESLELLFALYKSLTIKEAKLV